MLRSLAVLAAVGLGFTGLGGEAQAQGPRVLAHASVQAHFDAQATALRAEAAALAGELRELSRQGANHRRLYLASTEFFFLADHVHELMHGRLNINHLSQDVEDLDRVFHRMEDLSVGLGGAHGHHHHHDHDIGEVAERMERIEDTLHHLRDDLAQLRRPVVRTPPRATRPGITIGNGRIRLELDQ